MSYPYETATNFQCRVWNTIWSLNKGEVISYKELADRANLSNSVRAVASSCGKNPLAIIVPCHRIIRSNNDIGKYRWGDDLKRKLLKREGYTGIL